MLIDKYLPAYDFNEFHSVELDSAAKDIYQKMLHCDLSNNHLIRFFFRLRGIPKELYNIDHLTKMGFIRLGEEPAREIIFGMITGNPMFNSCKPNFSPVDFLGNSDTSIIKAVINFQVQDQGNSKHTISTETRVWCGNKKLKSKFRLYWFFVKPFSQLIRKSMLRQMKRKITAV
jgi:hypothetical protein